MPVSTSGEPIMGTPEDRFPLLMGTQIEVPAVANSFLRKEEQRPEMRQQYQHMFTPD
jgi:hypothetical protein